MRTIVKISFIAGAVVSMGVMSAQAQTSSEFAYEILKNMTDYVSAQDTVSFDFSTDLEVVTKKGFKLQFPASGEMLLDRPDKFRLSRTGGRSDIELISDGKTVSLYGRKVNAYAESKAPKSLDAFINQARDKRGVDIPGADLLLVSSYKDLTESVTEAMYLGNGVVDGVVCEHLAFRTPDVDWQIWIALGSKPYPCKYVVTSKLITAAPQYQIRFSNWNDTPIFSSDAFKFEPAKGAKKVDLADIESTDAHLPETKVLKK
jgi:hypothetical protein